MVAGINPPRPDDYTCGGRHDYDTARRLLIKQLLPPNITQALAWETLARESGTFIDPELRNRQSDLLFSIQLAHGTGTVLFYLLLEHQSSNDPDMPLRVLEYLMRIWRRYRKAHKGPLPIIIPILISNAPGAWRAPITFHELFDLDLDGIPNLGGLVPNFSLLLLDLMLIDDEELLSWMLLPVASLILKTLRDGRHKDRLLHNLDRWRERVREILAVPGGRAYIEQWLHYIWLVTPDLDFEEVYAKLLKELPETKDVAMTIAEQLEARGEARGEANARVKILTKQMTLKFGELSEEQAAHLAEATKQQLDTYIERILTASTPEDVFAVD